MGVVSARGGTGKVVASLMQSPLRLSRGVREVIFGACVDDAAVVAGPVLGDAVFFVHDCELSAAALLRLLPKSASWSTLVTDQHLPPSVSGPGRWVDTARFALLAVFIRAPLIWAWAVRRCGRPAVCAAGGALDLSLAAACRRRSSIAPGACERQTQHGEGGCAPPRHEAAC